ncbi:MAG: hypothetical protein GX270_16235 [Clostridiaceae bacterium]|nr:hypothetical protein [Clostridiaceae bacterium]
MDNDYITNLKYGQHKETVIINILNIAYGISSIQDNTENVHDLKLNSGCLVEVKCDSNIKATSNFWLELFGNFTKQKLGWFFYTDCNILAYCAVKNRSPYELEKVFFIDFHGLYNFVKEKYYSGNFTNEIDICANIVYKGNEMALLIPISEVKPFIVSEFTKYDGVETFCNPKYKSMQEFSKKGYIDALVC